MIGLVLVTHGKLATEFAAAMEHIVGPQTQLETVCIGPEDDMEVRRADIEAAVGRVDIGKGVILLTDMFGGTPSNLAISCMSRPKVEVLAGINLPMLVKLAKVRDDKPLPDHFRVRVRVVNDAGVELCASRELAEVHAALQQRGREATVAVAKAEPEVWRRARTQWEKGPQTAWTFGDVPARVRVGLKVLGGPPAREGAEIADINGKVVGVVTSGGFAPSLGCPIAMGFVPPALSAVGTKLNVIVRGRAGAAEVVAMPFVPNRYVRKV